MDAQKIEPGTMTESDKRYKSVALKYKSAANGRVHRTGAARMANIREHEWRRHMIEIGRVIL